MQNIWDSKKDLFKPTYTGKQLDETIGLYYFNARWYDPSQGRFITQDPARDGINWWGYCKGNPVNFLDPDGQTATGVVLGWIGTDVAVPEPTDLIPWKWGGYGAAITGAAGIPYTETSIEEINATGVLNAVQDSPNHVSVKPNDMSTMIEWQVSRENANTSPHEYTIILQSISKKGIE